MITKAIKYSCVFIIVICCSCKQNSKERPETKVEDAVDAVVDDNMETIAYEPKTDISQLTLKEVLEETPTKTLPHIETTNFDDFIDPDDYKDIDSQLFKLESIYPNFHTEGHNYRAIRKYMLPLHEDFYSVVITIEKGENEMETLLVNYTKDSDIIDHKVVSYDEIAEGWTKRISRISEHTLITNYITWFDDKEIQQIEYTINENGTITKKHSEYLHKTIAGYDLINTALEKLDLKWVQLKTDLIASKTFAENPEETVILLPKVKDEGEGYLELNVDIVLADNDLENNNRKYIKSEESIAITSDAIQLRGITIEDTLYPISENKNAYGIKTHFVGLSQMNPYENEQLSLFVKSENSLKKVLDRFNIKKFRGEWANECAGQTIAHDKKMKTSPTKTHGYFDIAVENKITTTLSSFKDEHVSNSDCETKESTIIDNLVLKFDGERYQEMNSNYLNDKQNLNDDTDGILYEEYPLRKLKDVKLDNFYTDNAYQLGAFKIVTGNYEPKDGQIVAPDTETDWGDRLLLLDANNQITYKSQGVGDVYGFQPHFYKNNTNDKTIIICQMTFEYPFGGETFLYEKGKIKHIGTLDIEGYNPEQYEEKYLTEIVKIDERSHAIEFTFKADSLVLSPGRDDTIIKNDNVKYVYKGNELSLERN